jgi:hypothetical protein
VDELVHLLTRGFVVQDCAYRNFEDDVLTVLAGAVRAHTVLSTLRFVLGIETEVNERVVALAGFHDHVSAASAVSARRPAARDEFFAAEGDTAIPPVARGYADACFINEHIQQSVASSQLSGRCAATD